MRLLPAVPVLVCASASLLAQSNCTTGPSPSTTFATQNPFAGGSLYGHPNYPNPPGPSYTGFSFLMDIDARVPIDITGIDIDLYDAGGQVSLGNGTLVTSPNQVGSTALVDLFFLPGTWNGNELTQAAWIPVGTGFVTVGNPHAASPAVFAAPVTIPSGPWALAFVVYQTTGGPAPGPLHPMVDPTTVVPPVYNYSVFDLVNVVFQRESWTATLAPAAHTQNLAIHFSTQQGYAGWTTFGTGCVTPNAPVLGLSARPAIGTTFDFQTTNIQAGSLFTFMLLSSFPDPTGLPLAGLGLPGCTLYLQASRPIFSSFAGVANGAASLPMTLPNSARLSGTVIYGQSAPLVPTAPGGFNASNAVCVAVGLF